MEIWKNLKTYLKIFGSLIIFKSFDTSQMWTNIQRICRFCGLMSAIFFGSKINMLNMFSRFWTVESFKRLPGSFWYLIWRISWIGYLRIHLWKWGKIFSNFFQNCLLFPSSKRLRDNTNNSFALALSALARPNIPKIPM